MGLGGAGAGAGWAGRGGGTAGAVERAGAAFAFAASAGGEGRALFFPAKSCLRAGRIRIIGMRSGEDKRVVGRDSQGCLTGPS